MDKTKKAIEVRLKVIQVLSSCESIEQLNDVEAWARRIDRVHPDALISGSFQTLFSLQFMTIRSRIIKKQRKLKND